LQFFQKKRVSEKRKVKLSPIEVVLDEMRQRVQELEDVALIGPTYVEKKEVAVFKVAFV